MSCSIKLTAFSHSGGCGCKIAPDVLARLLENVPKTSAAGLLVGRDLSDDAAVYRLNHDQALVATADFFTPIVDDPFDFGRIAAANALSDVYAMGGRPMLALNLVGAPLDRIDESVVARILAGGQAVCDEAGVAIAGGHSIAAPEPFYGLAAFGLVHPARIATNAGAQTGDALILGKPLGIGVLGAALKHGLLDDAAYSEMVRWAVKLNEVGPRLAELDAVHAMTDVTGFGLLGHLLEVCRASRVSAVVRPAEVPWMETAREIAAQGIAPGAAERNWKSCAAFVRPPGSGALQRILLNDPQTSGGLLVACAPETAVEVLEIFREHGFDRAAAIGFLDAIDADGVCISIQD